MSDENDLAPSSPADDSASDLDFVRNQNVAERIYFVSQLSAGDLQALNDDTTDYFGV